MRPRDLELRKQYADAASSVVAGGRLLTTKNLAEELDRQWRAVRKLLRRDSGLAIKLGVLIKKHRTVADYREAICAVECQGKVTHARLAAALSLDRTSVTRFLDAHSELRIGKLEKRKKPARRLKVKVQLVAQELQPLVSRKEEEGILTRAKEIGVSYWHETTQRMTFASVTLPEYARLWDKGLLKFQQLGIPKPEHLPTRTEVSKFI